MHYILATVDRLFGRRPKHALGFGAVLTVAVIAARLSDERAAVRKLAAYHGSVARQTAISAAMDAPTEELPVIDAEIVDGWKDPAIAISTAAIVQGGEYVTVDPAPTLPLTRAELAEVIEVSGGRPMHDLDFVTRYSMGGAR